MIPLHAAADSFKDHICEIQHPSAQADSSTVCHTYLCVHLKFLPDSGRNICITLFLFQVPESLLKMGMNVC